ncbi:hypothetical protein KUCAC02_005778 [Chaenocephalus aceratus]|uniref:Uncharacterized protein n=1 Tax=Chaenocephalus aceratus TaxID=36190 RepID=A0ACB9WR40_CHAAC|nr:hypothetical protein KUCAC02_005778 [Chaenocephalus aceratus]
MTLIPSLNQAALRMSSGSLTESQACQSPNRCGEALGSVCTADASPNYTGVYRLPVHGAERTAPQTLVLLIDAGSMLGLGGCAAGDSGD